MVRQPKGKSAVAGAGPWRRSYQQRLPMKLAESLPRQISIPRLDCVLSSAMCGLELAGSIATDSIEVIGGSKWQSLILGLKVAGKVVGNYKGCWC